MKAQKTRHISNNSILNTRSPEEAVKLIEGHLRDLRQQALQEAAAEILPGRCYGITFNGEYVHHQWTGDNTLYVDITCEEELPPISPRQREVLLIAADLLSERDFPQEDTAFLRLLAATTLADAARNLQQATK